MRMAPRPSSRSSLVRPSRAFSLARTLLLGLLVLVGSLWTHLATAQVPDTTQTLPDTTALAPDSALVRPDTLRQPTTAAPAQDAPSSGLKAPIQFTAQDSLVIVFDDETGDEGILYGEAQVTYDDAQLAAYRVEMLFEQDELRAAGMPVDTGLVGRPTFTQGGETFYGNALAYNMQTERGRVVEAQTAVPQGEGTIMGGVVKVVEDSTIYVANARYTTCPCVTDPSYTLRASRMKIRGKWIYSGPIRLYLFNIPTPLWLPFGFLPAQEGRRSGPLPPNYGEDERGFYLRDWGWYWAINDYMDLQARFGIWSQGSWQVAPLYRYNRRYRYNGQLQVDYVQNRRGEREDPDFSVVNTASLRWNHSQTISPTASFSGNVDLSTQNYLRTVSEQYDDRVRQTIQSSIRYSKRWGSGRSLTATANQQQQLASGQVSMTLPQIRFSQNQRKPFQRESPPAGARERWYERITYSYTSSLDNSYRFTPQSDTTDISWYEALFSPSKYEQATGDNTPFEIKATHRLPIAAPFSIQRLPVIDRTFILNLSPNLNYTEDWFFQTTRRFVDSTGTLINEQDPGFFALRQFSSGVSANTTIYGLFPIGIGPYQGVRHTLRPTLSFNYRPDFSSDFWGYRSSYVDTSGNVIEYDRVPGVQRGLQQALSFSLTNVFETKRVETDTTGEERSRTLQLLNMDVNGSYNFAADSLRLSDISLSARTRLFGQVDVSFRSSFSPYQLNADGTRPVDRFVFGDGPRLARLTQLSLTARTSIRSRNAQRGRPLEMNRARMADTPGFTTDGDVVPPSLDPFDATFYNTAVGYADFAIPWSLNLDFTYGLSRPASTLTRRAIFNVGFDFNATPKWKVQGRSGYDIERKEVVSTNLIIVRDFDCWQMSFNWVPFGAYQSYSFLLQVKSGPLRDILRLRQPRSDVQGRFGQLIQ